LVLIVKLYVHCVLNNHELYFKQLICKYIFVINYYFGELNMLK